MASALRPLTLAVFAWRTARVNGEEKQPLLRPVDLLVVVFMAALLLLAGLAWSRGLPHAREAVGNLGLGLALLFALRGAAALVKGPLTTFLAANAPIAMVPIDWSLDPIVDLVHPALADPKLLATDRFLFGETPSVLLEPLLSRPLTEALLTGYLSYFCIIGLPLVLLWWRDREGHAEYARALTLLFILNLSFYVLVPAVGPRFQVASEYAGPLRGLYFGDRIRDMFLSVPFFRDCFPSGHTSGTLLALLLTRRRLPVFFWAALPFGALCIAATVLCRFHYAVDLLCALPLLWCAIQGSRALAPQAVSARLRAAFD